MAYHLGVKFEAEGESSAVTGSAMQQDGKGAPPEAQAALELAGNLLGKPSARPGSSPLPT